MTTCCTSTREAQAPSLRVWACDRRGGRQPLPGPEGRELVAVSRLAGTGGSVRRHAVPSTTGSTGERGGFSGACSEIFHAHVQKVVGEVANDQGLEQIGRASCRERVVPLG